MKILSLLDTERSKEIFEKFLTNKTYFLYVKNNYKYTSEKIWQTFFEKNPWIFGYGLGYIFLSQLDGKKLEQIVQGYNVNTHGKRVDGLMKTKGIISNLCFVEIKTDETNLLEKEPYRSGCYAASRELAGTIAQVQGTVSAAVKSLSEHISVSEADGTPTGEEIYNYQPKAFLVIGSLGEFKSETGVNKDKLQSFELLRKNIHNVEILTFDELYERARFITEYDPKLYSE